MADPPKANLQQQPKFTELNDLTGEKVRNEDLIHCPASELTLAQNLL